MPQLPPLSDEALKDLLSKPTWAKIATASPNVAVLYFGAVDLSADLGCAIEWDALLYARSRVVAAAALAGVDAIDTPFMDVSATVQLGDEARAVRRLLRLQRCLDFRYVGVGRVFAIRQPPRPDPSEHQDGRRRDTHQDLVRRSHQHSSRE